MAFLYDDKEGYSERKKNPKFNAILDKLTASKKFKNMSWDIEQIQFYDLYRFFKKYGKIRHSVVVVNRHWGPYFREAIISFQDFIVTVKSDMLNQSYMCTIFHRRESEIKRLWVYLNSWILKYNAFRGAQFTYSGFEKPKMTKASFINDSAKKLLEENTVLFFRKLRQLKKNGLKTKRGIMLYGNPGNGKTSICRWISENLPGVTRIWVTGWEMRGSNISELFEIARDLSPSIIFLEDIDTAGISRHITGRINPLLGKLLNEMDGIQRNDDIVVIATTNNIHVIDEALANRPGRFDLKIHIGNPHPRIIKRIAGHEDDITLAEAFRRKEDKIYYEKILGRKYKPPIKRDSVHYIG